MNRNDHGLAAGARLIFRIFREYPQHAIVLNNRFLLNLGAQVRHEIGILSLIRAEDLLWSHVFHTKAPREGSPRPDLKSFLKFSPFRS
jgi:hypothetical protein